jgi:lysophospholipase L1-like esterase
MLSVATFALLVSSLPRVLTQNVDDSDNQDLYDFSWITKWSAIGDSYAAGIGAGNSYGIGSPSLTSYDCSRYDGAYPNLINLQLGTDPESIDFMFSACSGAVTSEVIEQAKDLTAGQQIITISSGGNDAGLSSIIQDCIYKFFPFGTAGCIASLEKSQSTMESDQFASKLDELLNMAKSKLADNGTM